jgi:hypothetical protein
MRVTHGRETFNFMGPVCVCPKQWLSIPHPDNLRSNHTKKGYAAVGGIFVEITSRGLG